MPKTFESIVDDIVTMITDASTDAEARTILSGVGMAELRGVADLTYALDYPDTAGRDRLVTAILRAARA